jgi:hypothetical protein
MHNYKLFLIIFITVLTTICFAEINICGTREAFERFQRGEKLLRPPNGPLYIYTPHFIIHYDTIGTNACTHTYAESIATFAEYSWAKEVGGLGWAAPPPDASGPDSRYDIYVQNISYAGLTYLDTPYPTPYPNGYSSYIVLKNYLSNNIAILPTVSHEFNHACQIRYNGNYSVNPWWYENTASWMSDVCCADFNLHISFYYFTIHFPNPLDDPDLNVTYVNGHYEYTGFIWPTFLHEYYSITSLRLMWERLGNFPYDNACVIIDTILQHYDSDFNQALAKYAVWRYFTGERADTINYFKESHLWPTSFVDSTHQHQGPGSGNQGTRSLIGPGGTSYIEFYTTPDYLLKNTVDFSNPSINKTASCIGYGPVTQNKTYMMDSLDPWSVLPTMSHDTFVFVPVNASLYGASSGYNYSGTTISSNPSPPSNPELQVCSIISPRGQISPYSNITPRSIRRNNGTSTVDSTWVSFYISNQYSDSRILGPLSPGQVDTISFTDWTAKERNAYDVQCVAGGLYDVNRANNCCTTSVFVPLTDFEILEILAPRGVVTQNVTVTPRILVRNNSTSGNNIFATLSIGSYTDSRSLYLGMGQSGEMTFNNFTPPQLGICTTRCNIISTDQKPFNNNLNGEILVVAPGAITENNNLFLQSSKISIFPNPTRNYFTIRLPQTTDHIKIFDVSGKAVKELESFGVRELRVSLDGIKNGIYFVKIDNDPQVTKIIVTK